MSACAAPDRESIGKRPRDREPAADQDGHISAYSIGDDMRGSEQPFRLGPVPCIGTGDVDLDCGIPMPPCLTTAMTLGIGVTAFLGMSSGATAEVPTLRGLYLSKLHAWVADGGDPNSIERDVLEPCSKLVIVTASLVEQAAFMAHMDLDTYDARVGFCMQAVVNTIYPQDIFQKEDWVESACSDPAEVMQIVCSEFLDQRD